MQRKTNQPPTVMMYFSVLFIMCNDAVNLFISQAVSEPAGYSVYL